MVSHCLTVYKWSKITYNCLCCLVEKLLHFLLWFADFVYTSGLKGRGQLFKTGYLEAQRGGCERNTGADVLQGTNFFDLTRWMCKCIRNLCHSLISFTPKAIPHHPFLDIKCFLKNQRGSAEPGDFTMRSIMTEEKQDSEFAGEA